MVLSDHFKIRTCFIPISSSYPSLLVQQDTAIGSTITTVSASDQDHGTDGQITYSIIAGNSENRFLIDANSGVIELRKSLDRESTAAYVLTVAATDHGSPNMSSTTSVNISVTDINDHAPVCNQTAYVIELAENTTVNSNVVSLQCSDADSGENSRISYVISSGEK